MNCVDFRTRNELNLSERRNACAKLFINCILHKCRIRQTVVQKAVGILNLCMVYVVLLMAAGCGLRYDESLQ